MIKIKLAEIFSLDLSTHDGLNLSGTWENSWLSSKMQKGVSKTTTPELMDSSQTAMAPP